jgi:hypothetical protein
MIYEYKGHFPYSENVIGDWNSSAIGIYYCGYPTGDGTLATLYVGRSVGQDGIRGRLLQHLRVDNWPRVTHFGFVICDTEQEVIDFEAIEIERIKPEYNTQGK